MNRYRPVKYCGTWCIYDENIHKTIYSNTEKHMIELCAALNNKEQPANGSVAGGQGSTNSRSDEIASRLVEALAVMAVNWQVSDCNLAYRIVKDSIAQLRAVR